MTAVQAEAFVTRSVKGVDQASLAQYQQEVAREQALYQAACVTVDQTVVENRQHCSIVKQNLSNTRDAGCDCVYRATQVDCRGDSPSTDSYHFTRFRCKALFVTAAGTVAGWRRGILKPVRPAGHAVWTWT